MWFYGTFEGHPKDKNLHVSWQRKWTIRQAGQSIVDHFVTPSSLLNGVLYILYIACALFLLFMSYRSFNPSLNYTVFDSANIPYCSSVTVIISMHMLLRKSSTCTSPRGLVDRGETSAQTLVKVCQKQSGTFFRAVWERSVDLHNRPLTLLHGVSFMLLSLGSCHSKPCRITAK